MLKRLAAVALATGAVLGAAPLARADVITLRADEWCPYNCAPDSDKPGYGVEIAKEVFSKAGHTLDYKNMAWARAIEECRKGAVVAVIGTTKEETPDFVFTANPIGASNNAYVVKKGNPWRYAGPASLAKLKMGTIQGYGYNGELGAYVEANLKDKAKIDVTGGDNALELNLKKLVAGRIDVTTDAKPVLEFKLQQMSLTDKVDIAGVSDPDVNFIAFSPAHPKAKEYAAILDKGIDEMRASGRLKQILDRYGVSDWK